MKAVVEIQVIPIGSGVSVRKEITRVVDILSESGLVFETHASGTDIEGELEDIFALIEKIHKTLHREGTVRLVSYIKLETRSDKAPTIAGKRL